MRDAYAARRCQGLAGEATSLAEAAPALDAGRSHIIEEPLAAFPIIAASPVKDGEWGAVIAWTIATLIRADAQSGNWAAGGIDSRRAEAPELRLGKDWQKGVIEAVGGYGDIFRRNLGADSPYRLPRGLNAPWREGGLLLPPSME